jgi:hypothetical protein
MDMAAAIIIHIRYTRTGIIMVKCGVDMKVIQFTKSTRKLQVSGTYIVIRNSKVDTHTEAITTKCIAACI